MKNILTEKGKYLFSALLLIYLAVISLLNNDIKILLALIIFLTIVLALKKIVIFKMLPLACLLLVPALAMFSNKGFVNLDYKILFYSLIVLIIVIIWEIPLHEK